MNLSLVRRIHSLERARAVSRRTHYLFRGMDETPAQLQARIDAMIASGEASRNDQFITFAWESPAGEADD
jgi:hypothetical protein